MENVGFFAFPAFAKEISMLRFIFAPFLAIVLLASSFLFAEEPAPNQADSTPTSKTLHVLTVGNSFSVCLERYFPSIVRSVPGCDVHLESIYIGGCTLERHWNNIVTEEANPDDRYFKEFTYRQKFESQPWDFVSIQQASGWSWRPESYFPFAEQLTNYIKQYAPTAEVVIQQTWAYRPDEPRLKEWGLDQKGMYDKLAAAYASAAAHLNLRVIPVGLAMQMARENQPGGYEPFDRADLTYPNLPDMSRYFCGSLKWKDEKTLEGDAYHLNRRGDYLQACVWFALLFDHSATDIRFVPDEITEDDAQFLRETAQKAVETYKQN